MQPTTAPQSQRTGTQPPGQPPVEAWYDRPELNRAAVRVGFALLIVLLAAAVWLAVGIARWFLA